VARKYVSNRNESVRIYRSDLLERLTHVHPAVPHLLYLPVIAVSLGASWVAGLSSFALVVSFLAGMLLWTLVEYLIHRFAFHVGPAFEQGVHELVQSVPRGEAVFPRLASWRQRIYFLAHGVHHDYPSDARRLVMPPVVSIPLALAFFAPLRLALGPAVGPALFAGLVSGYLAYDTIHYLVHNGAARGPVLAYLKKKHYRHHYGDSTKDYGVSSPLWDMVLGTLGRRGPATSPEAVRRPS